MWIPYEGPVLYEFQPKQASQVLSEGAVVDMNAGQVDVAVVTAASHKGVCQKTVLSTDADYAANTLIPLIVPMDPNFTWQVDVLSTDVLAASDVDTFFDLSGSPVGISVTKTGVAHNSALCKDVNTSAQQIIAFLNSYKPMHNGV